MGIRDRLAPMRKSQGFPKANIRKTMGLGYSFGVEMLPCALGYMVVWAGAGGQGQDQSTFECPNAFLRNINVW